MPGAAPAGPEWRTDLRYGVGAATGAEPADLAGVGVEQHSGFDRIVLHFSGGLPGYRVAYRPAGNAGAPALGIRLEHIRGGAERHLRPGLPAVRELRAAPAAAGTARLTVTLPAGTDRLPFRVGLAADAFYVDVVHPDGEHST
ncbi:hypothetical protein Ari01nite_87010 [Paractinoplanes rishiriensis]|uniref:Uncharacterized protein n=1 Tax=Paractinoplanes rishiriensis TaxID=1050105 RepID=A0A919K5F1_9ACTN|nr:hypothetical protein Ari01nite_87010 [Actinoplanes rishiriensis]